MRTVLAGCAALLLAAAPAFAQSPTDQSGTQQQPPGVVPDAGGGQSLGSVFMVPRSMGLPPGAVVLVPHLTEAAQNGGGGPGMAQMAGSAQQPGGSMPAAQQGVRPSPGLGVWLSLHHAGDSVEVRCAPGEATQGCIQSAAPLISLFLSSFNPKASSQSAGNATPGPTAPPGVGAAKPGP